MRLRPRPRKVRGRSRPRRVGARYAAPSSSPGQVFYVLLYVVILGTVATLVFLLPSELAILVARLGPAWHVLFLCLAALTGSRCGAWFVSDICICVRVDISRHHGGASHWGVLILSPHAAAAMVEAKIDSSRRRPEGLYRLHKQRFRVAKAVYSSSLSSV